MSSAEAVLDGTAPVQAPVRPWPVFWVTCIAVFLVSLDGTLLFAAFGTLRAGFPGVAAADLSWVLNGYSVVFAAMLIPGGGLADRLGRKRVFLAGVALFLAASLACGLAPDIHSLIAARVLQAVGAALLTPASLSLVLDAFPSSKRAIVVSLWGAVGALAAATGPGLGSLVVDTLGWHGPSISTCRSACSRCGRDARCCANPRPPPSPDRSTGPAWRC
jgi:MFS family permease